MRDLLVKYVLAVAFLIVSTAAYAQFNVGIQAGVTTSNFNQLFSKNSVPQLGFSAELYGELKFLKRMRLRAGVNGSWKGTNNHFWLKDDVDLFYLGIPVLLEVELFKNFLLGGGVEANYLLGSNNSGAVKYEPNSKWDIGLVAQVEYRFFSRFGINLRYTHGLMSIDKLQVAEVGTNTQTALANRSLQLGVSYTFGRK
ncbi:MAG: porin family protein [Aureispira sp.]|nr:porin family protein [Aureispira sp.]